MRVWAAFERPHLAIFNFHFIVEDGLSVLCQPLPSSGMKKREDIKKRKEKKEKLLISKLMAKLCALECNSFKEKLRCFLGVTIDGL